MYVYNVSIINGDKIINISIINGNIYKYLMRIAIMERTILKEIILSQNISNNNMGLIERDNEKILERYVKNKFVIVISGIRRCGKSTILKKIKSLYPGYYLNFDDERLLNFKIEDFQLLYETFIEIYGHKEIFYFDEIQNVFGWERFVRRLNDDGKKVFVTGSNANILSRELGTHLTGRYLEIKMYPFSFKEFLRFKEFELKENFIYDFASKANIKKYFDEYLLEGGFPEYLQEKNNYYLKLLYENILYRDIIVRYNLLGEKNLKDLVYLAVTNLSSEISFNSLTNSLNISSPTTIKEYFSYLENSYLAFLISRFNYSLKKQIRLPKKVYIIDNALATYLGFRFSKDFGRLLENLVFLELKRRDKDIYSFLEKNECDFIIRDGLLISEAIQVCYDFNNSNRDREIFGLIEAMKKFKLRKGLILTYEHEEEIKIKSRKINILPVWKWLLSEQH
jgi:predicted AAA+ superfamily ATPase